MLPVPGPADGSAPDVLDEDEAARGIELQLAEPVEDATPHGWAGGGVRGAARGSETQGE